MIVCDRFLPRRAAAGAADLRLFAACRSPASACRRSRRLRSRSSSTRRATTARSTAPASRASAAANGMRRARPASRAFAHARLRGAAAGGAQRAARSRLQHRRGREAHLHRQRRGAARTALFGRHGALAHLQRLADRACGGDLSRHAMAGGPADQPARTKNGIADVPCPRRVAAAQSGPDPEGRVASGRRQAPLPICSIRRTSRA